MEKNLENIGTIDRLAPGTTWEDLFKLADGMPVMLDENVLKRLLGEENYNNFDIKDYPEVIKYWVETYGDKKVFVSNEISNSRQYTEDLKKKKK